MTIQTFNLLATSYPNVLARALYYQGNMGRKMTYSLEIDSSKGFSWKNSSEGVKFWSLVFNGRQFPNVVKSYKWGDTIKLKYKGKVKEFKFLSWDLPHCAVLVMTTNAFKLFNEREAGENTRQDLRKMSLKDIVWQ